MVYKNQKHVLVPAGRWQLKGFTYGRARCTCCGRPITNLYHLINQDHKAKLYSDPTYSHLKEIVIGCVCGPKVFKESCEGFYDDPDREWNRQHAAFKDYINYILLNVRNKDLWTLLPDELCKPIDNFLEFGYKKEKHSGPWWRIRDVKRKVLNGKRDRNKKPIVRNLLPRVQRMIIVAKHLEIIPEEWNVNAQLELIKNGRN